MDYSESQCVPVYSLGNNTYNYIVNRHVHLLYSIVVCLLVGHILQCMYLTPLSLFTFSSFEMFLSREMGVMITNTATTLTSMSRSSNTAGKSLPATTTVWCVWVGVDECGWCGWVWMVWVWVWMSVDGVDECGWCGCG